MKSIGNTVQDQVCGCGWHGTAQGQQQKRFIEGFLFLSTSKAPCRRAEKVQHQHLAQTRNPGENDFTRQIYREAGRQLRNPYAVQVLKTSGHTGRGCHHTWRALARAETGRTRWAETQASL